MGVMGAMRFKVGLFNGLLLVVFVVVESDGDVQILELHPRSMLITWEKWHPSCVRQQLEAL
jgi:hypothetical protein